MSDYVVSIIRTIVPALAGILIAQAARVGINIDSEPLVAVLTSILIGVYYASVRAIASRDERAEWLLGYPKPPVYEQ